MRFSVLKRTYFFVLVFLPNFLSKAKLAYNLPNNFADFVCYRYGGIVLFSLFTAYDTVLAKEMYAKQRPDEVGIAACIGLDFTNLFLRFMTVSSKSQR